MPKIDRKIKKTIKTSSKEILPPLLFPAKTAAEEAWLTNLKKKKKIRKIGPRLYTSVSKSEESLIIKSQWAQIISQLFPKAILSHRSAIEYKPSPHSTIILTSTTNRKVEYPGLTLHFIRGPIAQSDDPTFMNFRVSSTARAYLENLSSSKTSAWRSFTHKELEDKLETLMQVKGEKSLNELRDQALKLSKKLHWENEFEKLDHIIGALLGTRTAENLKSSRAIARSQKKPFDHERVIRFDALFASLKSSPLKEIKENFSSTNHYRHKAFFESYFSNFIEGTEFEIEEAEEIIFDHKIPADRPKDAHDILGTFNIISDPNELKKTPQSASELSDLILSRHYTLMQNRPEVHPGQFKLKPNRAGNTHFVSPENIKGTLEQGFERYKHLPPGLPRAIFIMFLIAEIHPFTDGNGRISRIMMNAELYSNCQSTIIIPNVYREDYHSGLRALTRRDRPEPFIKMLTRAQNFSHLDFSIYKNILKHIEAKNWFRDATEVRLID